jgi:hypothetical protein
VKNGCFNRPPLGSRPVPVQDGVYLDGYTQTPRLVPLPFRMSRACEYAKTALGRSDKGCTGCKHREGA